MEDLMKNVQVVDHPLVHELITKLRNVETGTELYRIYTNTITSFLVYEALSDLKTSGKEVTTQTDEKYEGVEINEKIAFVSILRAGLGMFFSPMSQYPNAEFHCVGMKRNDEDPFDTEPKMYLDRLEELIADVERILVVDPMLATGGSMFKVIDVLKQKHKFEGRVDSVNLITAKPGVEKILKEYPDVKFFCAGYDTELNGKGFIIPGLGDAGDRYFGINTNLDEIR
jgi:uracil phosphoribosyltransferase